MARTMVHIPHRANRLMDEVYRQMFRLEEGRPGAEIELALALVRAWAATRTQPETEGPQDWLQKISPICIRMIEEASQRIGPPRPCTARPRE
jgi:hypothetical protein